MRWLKLLVAINGVIFVFYSGTNAFIPGLYFLPSDAPDYAVAVVHVVAVAYLTIGLVQVGTWMLTDRLAVRVVAFGSMVFAAGFAIVAGTAGTASSDGFHQFSLIAAVGHAIIAIVYAYLLYRERAEPA